MFEEDYAVVWGEKVPFDTPEKRLFMVYYGLYIKGWFIGCSVVVSRDNKQRQVNPTYGRCQGWLPKMP